MIKTHRLKTIPAKPEYAFDGDTVLVRTDHTGRNPIPFMVLSRQPKRELIPGDDSSPAGRAEHIGQPGERHRHGQSIPIITIDAILWRGVWYVQYIEVQQ